MMVSPWSFHLDILVSSPYKQDVAGTIGSKYTWPGLPWWVSGKEAACQCRRCQFDPSVRKILWRRKWQPTPVFLPGEFQGQRSLVD